MYVCMYVCVFVCLLMKGSVSSDPNNGKFTQKIDERSGHVNSYIPPKTVKKQLKNQFLKKGYIVMKLRTTCFSWNGARFSVEFSFADRLQGT